MSYMSTLKTCSTCKIEKTLENFGKRPKTRDGFNSRCKACCKEYRLKNRTRINEWKKQDYYSNHEKHLEQKRKDYEKHKDERLEKCHEYYEENKEYINKRGREYY